MSGFDINSAELGEQFTSLEIECFIPKAIRIKELVKRIETELSRYPDRHRIFLSSICSTVFVIHLF
jgi:hypothetical protein